jgi:DNA-directed RNA polymerase subunit beta'
VVELFEARKPKDPAIVSEIDGLVDFGEDSRGKRRIIVTPSMGEPVEYLVPKTKHVSVQKGDKVKAGEALTDGAVNPHDILRIEGQQALATYLVNEVQEIYRLQGVRINDKHIEIIVRQMLRRVKVENSGQTDYLPGESVERWRVKEDNKVAVASGRKPALVQPLLLGITKGALSTESFISAASFQETTKVLTEAAVCGKKDRLKGLKENVIMGRLIPAGSGFSEYVDRDIKVVGEEAAEAAPAATVPSRISQTSLESLAGLL